MEDIVGDIRMIEVRDQKEEINFLRKLYARLRSVRINRMVFVVKIMKLIAAAKSKIKERR